jgi:hypothetical protein
MIIENSSDIIVSNSTQTLQNGEAIEVLQLRDGKVFVISQHSLALYQHASYIEDPLGNGLLAICEIPTALSLPLTGESWLKQYRAGFIGLHTGQTLLITPLAIQLFACANDALHNRDEICRLNLESVYS